MRRHRFGGGRNVWFLWVGDCGKVAIFQLFVLFGNFILFFLQQLLKFVGVLVDGVGEIGKFERKDVGIRQAHDCGAGGLRKRAPIAEVSVGEMGVPVEVVVNGMVDAAVTFAIIG